MTVSRVVCTTCGNSLEASLHDTVATCDACGNSFLVTNGQEFAGKSPEEISSIKKLRSNLSKSVIADDHNNILSFSKEILRMIPKDYLASYYFAYANYTFNSRRYLFDFYNQDITDLPKDLNEIVSHMIEYGDVRDKTSIELFIAKNAPTRMEEYRDKYHQKLIDEENYSMIPRDVFVSFRSTDIEVASKVVEVLEKDGNTCWISSRNLRPNDNENYWTNIEDAISKCSVFLVVSSHEAMISRDVKKELDIATKLNKRRIEYKIDQSRHTSTFKYFFDGAKWVDGTDQSEESYTLLKQRVYSLLNSEIQQQSSKKRTVSSANIDEYTKKINRSKVELISSNFKEAANTIKDALGITPDSPEAWWLLFLAETGFSNDDMFNEYLRKNITLGKLFEMYNKVSYKQYKQYAFTKPNEFPPNIVLFEEIVYDAIKVYINRENLNPRSRRDYLVSHVPKHILTIWMSLIDMYGLKSDHNVYLMINNEEQIKDLENIFDDFEEIEQHPYYSKSHIKEYFELFQNNFKSIREKREKSLETLSVKKETIYTEAIELLENGKFKDAYKKSSELLYYDNSSTTKYMLLFLSKIKAKDTKDAYQAFAKLKRKDRQQLMQSVLFKKCFHSSRYKDYMFDLVLHTQYKKRKDDEKYMVSIRGDRDGV